MKDIEDLEIPTCIPSLGTKRTRRLKRLSRRAKHLKQRIKNDQGNEQALQLDRAELSALRWVIEYVLVNEGVIDTEKNEFKT